VGDGLDYPETLDDYAADKFTGLRPWSNDEPAPPENPDSREYKCDGCDTLVILEETRLCASCIMAFEEGDAPEELAITLGNKDRGRVCLNQTCPRYGQLTSWNFCQFCEHATVPV